MIFVSMLRRRGVLLATLTLTACVSGPPPAPPPPVIVTPGQTANDTADATVDETPQTVTLALLRQAETSANGGELAEAVELVERAIRIEPRRGDLWLRLGELNFQQNRFQQAEQFARKGLLFMSSGSADERSAWLLIAAAKEALGDDSAAQEIRAEWQRYRG